MKHKAPELINKIGDLLFKVADFPLADHTSEPMSYDECTIESLRTQLIEAIARAETAEKERDAGIVVIKMLSETSGLLQDKMRELTVDHKRLKDRLAERDASAKRWVRLS